MSNQPAPQFPNKFFEVVGATRDKMADYIKKAQEAQNAQMAYAASIGASNYGVHQDTGVPTFFVFQENVNPADGFIRHPNGTYIPARAGQAKTDAEKQRQGEIAALPILPSLPKLLADIAIPMSVKIENPLQTRTMELNWSITCMTLEGRFFFIGPDLDTFQKIAKEQGDDLTFSTGVNEISDFGPDFVELEEEEVIIAQAQERLQIKRQQAAELAAKAKADAEAAGKVLH